MENEFANAMSQRSDDDLIKIVTAERDKYNLTALEAADSEIKKRAIDTSKFEEIQQKTTKERVAKDIVDSNLAGSGARFLNHIIDSIIWIIATTIIITILDLAFGDIITPVLPLISLFLLLATFFAYYAILEIKFQKTIGKFITKTKVVKVNGDEPEESDIIMRTLCRLVPFDRITFLFMQNGIHDTLSKTKVVKDNMLDEIKK